MPGWNLQLQPEQARNVQLAWGRRPMALTHLRKLDSGGASPRMRIVVLALAGLGLLSCDAKMADNSTGGDRVPEPPKTPIMIRAAAGMPKEQAFLVDPARIVSRSDLTEAMRETGLPCDRVSAFSQLEQNGNAMDIYKLDCGARPYQVTIVEGNTHIKPWTGNIFGR